MNQSKLFDLIVEKSNQIAQLDGELQLAVKDVETLKEDFRHSSIGVNTLRYDTDNIIHSQTSLVERIDMLEKKLDVLCNHFSFLFTQLDEQQV